MVDNQKRIKRIKDKMESKGYNALIVCEPENIFYLTNFWGEGIVLFKDNELSLIVPRLEADRARKSSNGKCIIIESERGELLNSIPNINGKVGTDCNDARTFNLLSSRFNLTYDQDIFYEVRMIKDEEEISNIRKAAKLIDRLFTIFEKEFKVGMSELEIQAILMYEGLRFGLQPTSFRFTLYPLIIASGINSSLPHAQPTTRKVRKGDLITVDITLRYKGYVADATRTFGVNTLSQDKKRIYQIVKEAQEIGLNNIMDGVSAGKIDKLCRDFITKNGYGEYFIHSTGHGIGLEVHEPPWIKSNSNYVLTNGMTLTIEPGIYIKNKYGVRIEDSLLIAKKAKVLNSYTKELLILG